MLTPIRKTDLALATYTITLIAVLVPPVAYAQQANKESDSKQNTESVYKDKLDSVGLSYADAVEVAKTLNDQFDPLKFTANSSINRIYFRVPEDMRKEIRTTIDEFEKESAMYKDVQEVRAREEAIEKQRAAEVKLATFQLKHSDAVEVERILQNLGLIEGTTMIGIRADGNLILVRGIPTDVAIIAETIQLLDTPVSNKPTSDRPANSDSLGASRSADAMGATDNGDQNRLAGLLGLTKPVTEESLQQLQTTYAEVDQATNQLAQQIQASKPNTAESKQLKAELRRSIRSAFDVRQRLLLSQIQVHREKLDELQKRLLRRSQIVNQIVDHRVDELLSSIDEVTVEAINRGVIALRGTKPDVERVAATIKEIQLEGSAGRVRPSKMNSTEAPPTPSYETSGEFVDRGDDVIVNAESPAHLEEVMSTLHKVYAKDYLQRQMTVWPNGTSVQFKGSVEFLDELAAQVLDIDNRKELNAAAAKASQIEVRLIGPSGSTASWTFGAKTFGLPASFKMDAQQRMMLEISDLPTFESTKFYANIDIKTLSKSAEAYVRTHPLTFTVCYVDADHTRRGQMVVKSLYLIETADGPQVRTYSSVDRTETETPRHGQLIAELKMGNAQPKLSHDVPGIVKTIGSLRNYKDNDSLVAVELIVPAGGASDTAAKNAIYMDGVIVGDDGLVAAILPPSDAPAKEVFFKRGSVTLKAHGSRVVTDAVIVAYDKTTSVVLLQSNLLRSPAFGLNGPGVVKSQRVRVTTTKGIFHVEVQQPVKAIDGHEECFSIPAEMVPGSAVTLETTGQLVGVVQGIVETGPTDGRKTAESLVVPVSKIRDVVSAYHARDSHP